MQIKSVLVLLVIGAVAVLAKKGSSEEKDGQGFGRARDSNRKSNRYPQGRPFQVQSSMGGQFPQMSSYYPQRPMMQRPPQQNPFGQNSFSAFPDMNQQQQPRPSTYPAYNPFQSPFLGGTQPSAGTQSPFGNQPPFGSQPPFGTQGPTGSQFPFGSQFPGTNYPMN